MSGIFAPQALLANGRMVSLVFEGQPQHVPPFRAIVTGKRARFESLAPAQRHFIALRFLGSKRAGSAVTLASLLEGAGGGADDFAAMYPHPFLLVGTSKTHIGLRDCVYQVKSVRAAPGWPCPIHVGRAAHCDVLIDDQCVSRQHAVFEKLPDAPNFLLLDKGSHNGTRVGTRRLTPLEPMVVTSGSAVRFGDLPFVFLSSHALFQATLAAGLVGATHAT